MDADDGEQPGDYDMGAGEPGSDQELGGGYGGHAHTYMDEGAQDDMGDGEGDGGAAAMAAGNMDFDDVINGIPAFANAENRALNERLIAAQRRLAELQRETADHDSRVEVMREHLGAVRSEVTHAERLLEARQKELKTEEHLKALTERAVGRMRQEIATLDKQSDALAAQLSTVQASIYRGSERLESFKTRMQMAQEELEKLAAEAKRKEEDQMALAKYSRSDDMKIKDLTRELERLTVALDERKRELEREVTETKAKQVEVDKVAEDFRALHAERQHLVDQWQESLRAIERRDGDIAKAAEAYAQIKSAVNERRARIKEAEGLLQRLVNENKEMESSIEARNRAVGQKRDEVTALTERVNRFREEVDLLKSNVSAAASELAQKRAQTQAYEAERVAKEAAVTAAKAQVEELRAQLTAATAAVASTESSLAEREEYLRKEQARVEAAERRLAMLKEQLFKANDAVTKLKAEESTLRAEIAGASRTSRNLSDRIRDLDAQSLAQQEHVYAAEFQIQQMERKIARAKGEVSDEEKRALQERIAVLQQNLDDAITLEKSLSAQAKSVREELRFTQRTQATLSSQLEEVQSRIDELLLQNKSAEEGLRKLVKEKEAAMVSHDVLKLEVRKLRDTLSVKTDEVFTLENRAAQLAMTMEARKKEIDASKAVQRAAAKLLEDERHKLAMDLTDRQAKINLLKTKYEALCAKLRGSNGDDGEPKSQAYFILKAAQRREELQREGDELDSSIRKAEREVKALVATLSHLTSRNTALRDALHQVDLGSDEAAGVRALEARSKETADAVFRRKRELATLQQQAEENTKKAAAVEERIFALTTHIGQLVATREKVEAERAAQDDLVQHTRERLSAVREAHRKRIRDQAAAGGATARRLTSVRGFGDASPDEVAAVAQGIKECNASVLFTLGQLAREFPVLKPTLAASLAQFGLKMPLRPPSRVPGSSTVEAAASFSVPAPASGAATDKPSTPFNPPALMISAASTPRRPVSGGSTGIPVSPMAFPSDAVVAPRGAVALRGHTPLSGTRPMSAQSNVSARSNGSHSARGSSSALAAAGGIAVGNGARKGPVLAAGSAVLGLSVSGVNTAPAPVSGIPAGTASRPDSGRRSVSKPPTPTRTSSGAFDKL